MAKKKITKKAARKLQPRPGRSLETNYGSILRKVAREVGNLVERFNPTESSGYSAIKNALDKYSDILLPWAKQQAQRVVEDVDHLNRKQWENITEGMSAEIRETIRRTPIGERVKELMNEQVKLITSIPKEAANRVHKLVIENLEVSGRGASLEKEIKRSGKVAASRATLIARTEISRAGTVLTQARSEHVGSEGYIWRTVEDSDVRPSHKKMDGKYVDWTKPPTLDGLTGHAGALPNCRCYPEPVLPTIIDQE